MSCAVVDGRVACWGIGDHGRLGDGFEGRALRPVWAPLLTQVVEVSFGNDATFFRLAGGSISVVGPNRGGDFGDGSPDFHTAWTPRPVPQWGSVKQIRGGIPSCALRVDGKVECAGHPRFRSVREDRAAPGPLPVVVEGLQDIASIAAGSGFTCALRKDGAVFCWGMGDSGQLGNGSGEDEARPVRVRSLSPAVEIAAGSETACARLGGGGVWCWGQALSDHEHGRPPNWDFPIFIEGTEDAKQISIGDRVACAVTGTGKILCWGEASYAGQLGDGTSAVRPAEALPVACIDNAVQVSVGDNHSCALLRNGTARCWGSGPYGAIGNGKAEDTPIPSFVFAATDPAPPADRCPANTTFRRTPNKDKPGEVEEACEDASGNREGHFVSRWASGGAMEEGEYVGGKKHGDWLVYYEHGEIASENHFDKGVPVGVWVAYSLHYTFAFATCFDHGEKKWQVTEKREMETRSCP